MQTQGYKSKQKEDIIEPVDQYTSDPSEPLLRSQMEVTSHSYKLEVANFPKNIASDEAKPEYHKAEHVHFFHTKDRAGKRLIYSSPVGGHFHELEIVPNPKGEAHPPTVRCKSGPLKWVSRKDKYGNVSTRTAPAYEITNDNDYEQVEMANHKHKPTHIQTSKIKSVQLSPEAAKVIGAAAPPPAPQGLA
jgi:hypothetical protein